MVKEFIEIAPLIGLVLVFLHITWMVKMLKYTKENRVIQSMTLKTILKYCETKGVKIEIEKIQQEVENSVK